MGRRFVAEDDGIADAETGIGPDRAEIIEMIGHGEDGSPTTAR